MLTGSQCGPDRAVELENRMIVEKVFDTVLQLDEQNVSQ